MYSLTKTVGKGSLPIGIMILVNIALAVAKAKGLIIDETVVWDAAFAGYGAILALINWIKNHKKK